MVTDSKAETRRASRPDSTGLEELLVKSRDVAVLMRTVSLNGRVNRLHYSKHGYYCGCRSCGEHSERLLEIEGEKFR